ncbi:MAG: hypothetical protein H0U62_05730 [Actinobacteria bacterium]|nr:hypothetical protein [Actinomycetota bacterium]
MSFPEAWHAAPRTLQQYSDGTLTDTASWSVEAHLPGCEVCRERLAGLLSEQDWSELDARRQELRLAHQPAVNAPALARAPGWASLRGVLGPWWAWVGVVLAAFAAVTVLGRAPLPPTSLLTSWAAAVAPLVPLVMVAMVYAVGDRDPAAAVTPRGGLELVLIRTFAVLVVAIPTVTLGMVAGDTAGLPWLLPGLALCAGALALGPSVGVERSCVGLAVLWMAVVVAAMPPVGLTSAASLIEPVGTTSVLWGCTLLVAVGVIAVQRDRFDLPGRLS